MGVSVDDVCVGCCVDIDHVGRLTVLSASRSIAMSRSSMAQGGCGVVDCVVTVSMSIAVQAGASSGAAGALL